MEERTINHMPIITLVSDWNKNDYYTGALKGKILSACGDVQIIDINHQVPTFNISNAAFTIRNTFHHFPKGSIHLVFVNSAENKPYANILLKADGHYFVGKDNGLFSLIQFENIEEIIELHSNSTLKSFEELDVFSEIAVKLCQNSLPADLGKPVSTLNERMPLRATIETYGIDGHVVYIDSYKNAITNISKELFERIGKGRPFTIYIQSYHYKVEELSENYTAVREGELVALFNSISLLEIAINQGKAADLLNLRSGSSIRIKFKDKPEQTLF